MTNYLMLMAWIDERRIEMEAEGTRHWVPTDGDFWQAERDCWDDLVKPQPIHRTLTRMNPTLENQDRRHACARARIVLRVRHS